MMRTTRLAGGADGTVTLRLEGKLLRSWVEELAREWDAARREAGAADRVLFDLASLTFLDDAGTQFIRELMACGAQVTGCSRFVSDLLNSVQLENR
jgi:hypothetical protein